MCDFVDKNYVGPVDFSVSDLIVGVNVSRVANIGNK